MRGSLQANPVKGRNENSWDEKVTYDNQYIDIFKKQGVLLDIKILFLTIGKVFRKQDIYEEKADDNMSDREAAMFAEQEIIRISHLSDEENDNKNIAGQEEKV